MLILNWLQILKHIYCKKIALMVSLKTQIGKNIEDKLKYTSDLMHSLKLWSYST